MRRTLRLCCLGEYPPTPKPRQPWHPRPSDTLLVIEVADTSLGFDRERKVPLYGQHGIPEAWLVDLQAERLVRYRNPEHGTYALVDQPDLTSPLAIAALPETRVNLAALFE